MVQLRNDKEKSKVMSYATELLSQITVKPDNSASWSSNVRFDMQVEVLTEKIDFGDLSEQRGLSRMFVLNAIVSLKRQGKTAIDWNDLTPALTAEIQKYTSRPFFDYRICFPFHLTGSWITKKRKLNMMSLEFRKANWNQVVVMSGWKEFWKEAAEHSVFRRREGIEDISRWVLLFADVKARTEFEAFDKASRAFELLRAIINLVSDYQVVHHQFGIYTPFAKCLPAPVYGVFLTSGEYKVMYYTQEQYVYRRSDIDVESGMRAERLMRLVGKSSGQIQSVLVDMLLKYGQAMDTTDWRTAFLALWQILELASAATNDTSDKEVAVRITRLVKADSLLKDIIEYMLKTRNLLVHQGKFSEEGIAEVNYLKLVAELAINTLLANSGKLTSLQHLREYYGCVGLDSTSLSIRSEVIRHVSLQRAKNAAK